jgi:hypothetical protein
VNYILTVDPGVSGTGLALWKEESWGKLEYPVKCENIYPKKSSNWINRALSMTDKFSKVINTVCFSPLNGVITKVIIEQPKFFADSAEGEMHAKSDNLGKLYMLVGMFSYAAGTPVELIRVDDWKGQLSKKVVEVRIIKRLPEIKKRLNPKSHSFDAIGIGLAAQGFLTMRT